MTDSGLGRILAALPLDTIGKDPVELAEAVWLAEHAIRAVPPTPEATGPKPRSMEPGAPAKTDRDPVQLSLSESHSPREEHGARTDAVASSPKRAQGGEAPEQDAAGERDERDSAFTVRVPAGPALPGQLRYLNAMRNFKRMEPQGPAVEFDETATIRDSARAGVTVLRRRPRKRPWLSALCLIDGGRSMPVWRAAAREFAGTLRASGVFHSVEVLVVTEEDSFAGRVADGPRAVFVVSDGVGGLWQRPEALRGLARLARGGATAVFNPLPEHLWRRTALRPIHANIRSLFPGTPNDELKIATHGVSAARSLAQLRQGGARSPVPLPILELEPDRLAGWAEFVRQPAKAGFDCALTFAEPEWLLPPPTDAPPADLATRFLSSASPSAVRLAEHLAALGSRMNLEIMRYVQDQVVPESGPTHLAEVLLSGLLAVEDERSARDAWNYRFADPAREEFMSRLPFGSRERMLDLIARGIGRAVATSHRGFAASAIPSSGDAEAGRPLPFANVVAELADQLRRPENAPTPGGPRKSGCGTDEAAVFDDYARLAVDRFRSTGRMEDLDEAIGHRTAALAHSTRGARTGLTLNLAGELTYRWLFSRDPRDLDRAREVLARQRGLIVDTASAGSDSTGLESIVACESTLAALADPKSGLPSRFTSPVRGSRAITHLLRMRVYLDVGNEVERAREGVALAGEPQPPAGSAELALMRLALAVALGGPPGGPDPRTEDAAEAILLFQENLMMITENDLPIPAWSHSAACRALTLAQAAGEPESLDWAVGMLRASAKQTPVADAESAELLADLATALHLRYNANHEPSDLAEAILHLHNVTRREPTGFSQVPEGIRARCLYELGRAFEERYHLDHRLADLGEAAQSYRDAARLSERTRPELNAASLTAWGRVLNNQLRYDEARAALAQGIERYSALGHDAHPSARAAQRLKAEIDARR